MSKFTALEQVDANRITVFTRGDKDCTKVVAILHVISPPYSKEVVLQPQRRMEQFDIPSDIVYLDCAGRSPLPKVVEEIGHQALSWKSTPWKKIEDHYEDVANKYARLIGAESPHCIAFAPSTSFAMTLASENIIRSGVLGPGKFVLVMFGEMESVVYPWQSACQRTGATLYVVPHSRDCSWTESILSSLRSLPIGSLAVLALTCVHWCSGEVVDILEISRYLQGMSDTKPYLLIDGTQSIGIQPIDVQTIQPDFVACSVHKWLLSPYGCSLVYLHPRHHQTWQSLDQHDRNRLGNNEPEWVEISGMHRHSFPAYPTPYQWGAKCITAGGRPNPVLGPMINAALDLILNEFGGPQTIQSFVSKIVEEFYSCVEEDCNGLTSDSYSTFSSCGLQLIPKNRRSSHIIGISFHPDISLSPSEAQHQLEKIGVKISVRQSYLRISPYLYNTPDQMRQLYCSLRQILSQSGRKKLDNNLGLSTNVRPKILVTGGSGWLGQHLLKKLLHNSEELKNYEVHITYSTNRPHFLPQHQIHQLDFSLEEINNLQQNVCSLLSLLQPKIIIHLAAQSSPVECERDPAKAFRVNCPSDFVQFAKQLLPDSLFIYASTDLVYDGEFPPYSPLPGSMIPQPSTVYGRSKLQFESEVLTLKYGLVLRLSNMIGGGFIFESTSKSVKFFQWLQRCFLMKEKISLKNDEFRSFVVVQDVCELLLKICVQFSNGSLTDSPCWTQRIYNIGGPHGLSRLQFAEFLAEAQGVPLSHSSISSQDHHRWIVESVSSQLFPNPPPRDVTMETSLTTSHFGVIFQEIRDAIPKLLSEL